MTRFGITRLAALLLLIIAGAAFSAPAASQSPRAVETDDLLATLDRLSVKIPPDVYSRDPIRRHLGELSRERCDQRAIASLGKALADAGYRREATTGPRKILRDLRWACAVATPSGQYPADAV